MNTTENEMNNGQMTGNSAKILSMLLLGLGSFLVGIIPAGIPPRNRRRFPFLISLLLCFGAGVLFSTSIVHILPDVREIMPQNAELVFCCGFFLIYLIDEFVHCCFGEAFQHTHPPVRSNHYNHAGTSNYGSVNNETEPLVAGIRSNSSTNVLNREVCNANEANGRVCHVSHTEPCEETKTGVFGLLLALSLHSFIEGLAIGVQHTSEKVIILLSAVSCHKFVMAFCFGIEISANESAKLRTHFIAIILFSLGSVCGIGTGFLIVDLPENLTHIALPLLQALAGGTLLYVTVSEILPREKALWHQNNMKKFAGILQFLAVSVGFVAMSLINVVLVH